MPNSIVLIYLYVAYQTGLNPQKDKGTIIERSNEFKGIEFISELFAVNDIRQLEAHKADVKNKTKFSKALSILQIEPNSISNNYSSACYSTYDALINMFAEANKLLLELSGFG